jgi:hypothetical protein
MTAIGKLLALSALVAGLGVLSWSVSIYVQRPGWFADPTQDVDKGNKLANFKQLKADTEAQYRLAAVASEQWGTHLKTLEAREKLRSDRRDAYAERIRWAHKGNPNDPIDKEAPKLGGKGFYEPFIDPATKLYDVTLLAGLPKGKAVLASDGSPLPGRDGLLDSLAGDVAEIQNLNMQIKAGRLEFDKIDADVQATEIRLLKMVAIRDNVQAELFFLSTFEVNAFETRETVFRRDRQLRARLKGLGITEP